MEEVNNTDLASGNVSLKTDSGGMRLFSLLFFLLSKILTKETEGMQSASASHHRIIIIMSLPTDEKGGASRL